jgi:adenylate cyclase
MRRWFKLSGWSIGLASAFITLALWALGLAFIHDIELKTVDARFRLRGARPVSGDVVVAAIDSRSVDAFGRWPWPRTRMASLIDALHAQGAKVVALDIVFAEPDPLDPANDAVLASAVRRAGNVVLGYYFRKEQARYRGAQAGPAGGAKDGQDLRPSPDDLAQRLKLAAPSLLSMVRISHMPRKLEGCDDVEPNIPEIAASSESMGFFSVQPDADGVVRRIPLVMPCGQDFYGSLSLRAAQRALGNPPIAVDIAEDGVRGLTIGRLDVPVDENGFLRVNFPGPPESIRHYPVVDIIRGKVPPHALRGKVVVVGPTELGIEDFRPTPFSPVFPGVEIQADAVETLLHGPFIHRNNATTLIDIVLVILIGVGLGALLGKLPGAVHRAEALVGAMVILVLGEELIFAKASLQLTTIYPAICVLLTYLGVAVYEAFGVERQGREIRRAFEKYVSPVVVEMMVRDPKRLVLGGERRDITILFSDIEGFTTLSERLPPEDVIQLLNAYLTPMTDIVFRELGMLDKYIGDAVMAIYGAPIDLPDHPDRACRTALAMQKALAELKDEAWFRRGWPDVKIRVGINSGPMVAGNMGSPVRLSYTAIGDGVNLASRLEAQNKSYGTRILISEFTRERLTAPFILREIDVVRVKGKEKAVRVYELRGEGTPDAEEAALLRTFAEGLAALREGRRDAARERFQACLDLSPGDGPARAMIARCDEVEEPGEEVLPEGMIPG